MKFTISIAFLLLAGCKEQEQANSPVPQRRREITINRIAGPAPRPEGRLSGYQPDSSTLRQSSDGSQADRATGLNVDRKNPGAITTVHSVEEAIAAIEASGGRYKNNTEKLRFSGTKITDEQLRYVEWLTNVERLGLSGTLITDSGLTHLKGLTRLHALDLSDTQITNAGLQHLKGLNRLRTLSLTNTQVNDAGLEDLKRLSHLTILNLTETQMTDAAVEELRKALPDCDIQRSR